MPRQARIDVADHWYHVIARGQRREALFLSSKDKETYLQLLNEALHRNGASLGAYCLMSNHVHCLVYRKSVRLGTIFRQVHTKYAHYFNHKYGKTGYVFQGRFKSYIVLNDVYLATLLRYIHENPVKAKMVRSAAAYAWSSDAFYRAGKSPVDISLVCVPGFEGNPGRQMYPKMMASESSAFEDMPRSGQMIGTETEIGRLNRRTRPANRWVRANRRKRIDISRRLQALLRNEMVKLATLIGKSQQRSVSNVRGRLMARLYKDGYPPSQIAKLFKRCTSTVVHAHRRYS